MADENLGTLRYDIELDTKGLQRGAKKAESIMSRLQKHFQFLGEINQAGELMTRTGRAVFDFGKAFVTAAADLQKLETGLKAVAGSSEEASRQMSSLRQVAKLPGLGLEEAIQGSINLQAVGLSAEQAETALSSFGNALATVGKGRAELDGVILALTQMAAKGKISAEEINQIGERVPQIRSVMIEAFGTAVPAEIEKMNVSVNTFIDTVTAELGRLPSVAGGAANAFENLNDSFKQFRAELGDFLLPLITEVSNRAADAFEGMAESMMEPQDQLRNLTASLEEASQAFETQTQQIDSLALQYQQLTRQLARTTPESNKAKQIQHQLTSVTATLLTQVPELIKHYDHETNSIRNLNEALVENLANRQLIARAEFFKGLDQTVGTITEAQEEIENLNQRIADLDFERTFKAGNLSASDTGQEEFAKQTALALEGIVKQEAVINLARLQFDRYISTLDEGTRTQLTEFITKTKESGEALDGTNPAFIETAKSLNISADSLRAYISIVDQLPQAITNLQKPVSDFNQITVDAPETAKKSVTTAKRSMEELGPTMEAVTVQVNQGLKKQAAETTETYNNQKQESANLLAFNKARAAEEMKAERLKNQQITYADAEAARVAKESASAVTQFMQEEAAKRAKILAPSPVSGTSSMMPMVDAATTGGTVAGPGLMAMAVGNVIENAVMYTNAVADITDATAEWAEVTGKDGLAKSLSLTTKGLDLLVTGMTQGPIMAAFQGVGMLIEHFTRKAKKEAEKQEALMRQIKQMAIDTANEIARFTSERQSLGEGFISGLANAIGSGDFQQVEDAVEQQLRSTLTKGYANAVINTTQFQKALSNINSLIANDVIDGAMSESTTKFLQQNMADVRQQIERSRPIVEDLLRSVGFDPVTGKNQTTDQTTKGLSVAIRNITTRQADTLTRVLRGQMSLMSQIQSNTLRSATALETYLPTLETLNLSAPSTSNGSTFGAKASNILALETARTFAAAGI
jgi:tape measure domain-containing protein